jgi:hypothetical protein
MLRRHVAIAALFAATPLADLLFGVGPAFTMYAASVDYRIELRGRRGAETVPIPPSALARDLPPSARPFLGGAERFRRTSDVSVLRRHLDDIARLACRHDASFDAVGIVLMERSADRTAERRVSVRCVR